MNNDNPVLLGQKLYLNKLDTALEGYKSTSVELGTIVAYDVNSVLVAEFDGTLKKYDIMSERSESYSLKSKYS